jgi:ABC-type transport system involved in cytochrome bd biosynthesis fused ATPase/permease subunit
MAPRISNSAKIISNTIISTREVKPIIDMYITFLKKKGKVLNKKRNDRIYMSGTLPFVKKDVLFSIKKNGLYAITGSSGSGKTTVLKLLSGLIDKPENLTINVNSKNSLDFIGINPFYMEDTILENLKIATGKDERTVKRIVNYVTELSGVDFRGRLEEKCENYYSNYSDGQKRLINLCHILLSDSDVLLLDEPTANLDKKTKINLIKVLKELSKNKIIICTTHDQDLINDSEALSDLERRDMN